MVLAWFLDNSQEDRRLPHQLDSPEPVSLDILKCSGVQFMQLDGDNYSEELNKMKREKGFAWEDCIIIAPGILPDYEDKSKIFWTEHMHEDEEIRFAVEGSGYFDIRNKDDRWIRVQIVKGDLVILPAGCYHRFTLDTKDYIKLLRFNVSLPVWESHARPADDHPACQQYQRKLQAGEFK